MLGDVGEYGLVFLVGLAVGVVLGMGISSVIQRTVGRLFGWFGTSRERELRRESRLLRSQGRTAEARIRRKDEFIRQAIVTVQRENRERVERMLATHGDRALDAVLRWFRRPPRPVPDEAIRRCREAYPDTARHLERALKS